MKEFRREHPLFSLCGLNCCLCPRCQTDGKSRCPGCGGEDFELKHPACSVASCSGRHDDVQLCCYCSSYPCERYTTPNTKDSFITYRNVISDFDRIRKDGLDKYLAELNEKKEILEFLISKYNDGRRKNFYCITVNLLDFKDLRTIIKKINDEIENTDMDIKDKIEHIVSLLKIAAENNNIELRLRK
jgi:hypothetical protein